MWVKRFVCNLRRKKDGDAPIKRYLTVKEINEAERDWIIAMQRSLESKTKQLNNTLGLYLDSNGVLLCKGRLNNTELTPQQKNPILIPGSCYFARLLVMDAHLRTDHGGKKDTIVQLRSRFWVTKGRNLVRHVLHGCAHPCKAIGRKTIQKCRVFTTSELPRVSKFSVHEYRRGLLRTTSRSTSIRFKVHRYVQDLGSPVHVRCDTSCAFRSRAGYVCISVLTKFGSIYVPSCSSEFNDFR